MFHAFFMHTHESKIHIGRRIRAVLNSKGVTVTSLAESINTTRTNMHKILAKDNIDIALLARISAALEHDFFRDISDDMDL